MSKEPKHPSQRDGLNRRSDEVDAPRPRASTGKPRAASKRKADAALGSVSAEIPNGVTAGPEGSTAPSLSPAQDASARARSLIADPDQHRGDEQASNSESRGEAKQQLPTGRLAGVTVLNEPHPDVPGDLLQRKESMEMRPDQKDEPTQDRSIVHGRMSGSREDGKNSSRAGLEGTVRRGIRVWTPRLQAASDRVRDASRRVAVWTRETAARRAERARTSEPANPIYLVAAITLGIPALLTIPLIGMNPGIQEGAFSTVITFVVLAAFIVAALFEIKKLVDQPSDEEHH